MADPIAILSSVGGNVLLFMLVFGMSATVAISDLQQQIKNRRAIFTGLCCQFILLPLLGFLVVYIMRLPHAVGITLLVVTSSPGGSYSNWWCSLFNADLALSVTMTAISTILSVGMLPANLILYTHLTYDDDVVSNLDWKSLFVALFVVISAIFIGLFCSYKVKSKSFQRRCNALGNIAGITLIIFSATVTNTGDADSKIWSRDWTFYIGVCLPCLIGLLVANLIASMLKLKPPERVTVAIECCYQNVGIATSVALTMFAGDELNDAMGVPFLYGMAEILFISIYCVFAWKAGWTKAPANENICKVIATSYEVGTDGKEEEEDGDKSKDGDTVAVTSTTSSAERIEMPSP